MDMAPSLHDRYGLHPPPGFIRTEIDDEPGGLVRQIIDEFASAAADGVALRIEPDEGGFGVTMHHSTDRGRICREPFARDLLAPFRSELSNEPFGVRLILSVSYWIQDGDRCSLRHFRRGPVVIENAASRAIERKSTE